MDETDIATTIAMGTMNAAFVTVSPTRFMPLILEVMRAQNVSAADLSRLTGFSKTKISRCLSERRQTDAVTLQAIFMALEIDVLRALLALGRFGGWQHYFNPDVEIIADLINVLPNHLTEARSGLERFSVGLSGATVLAKRISEMIAVNDRETQRRRSEQPIYGA